MSAAVDAKLAEIVLLVQGLDDLITALSPAPRHRDGTVDVDGPTRITPVWPWAPKHVAVDRSDVA